MASPYVEEAARRAGPIKATAPTHTPGPWFASGTHIITEASPMYIIAQAQRYEPLHEPEANARLMAAAPELLAVVRSQRLMLYAWKAARANLGLADDHGELNQAIAETDEAIAKAEGT